MLRKYKLAAEDDKLPNLALLEDTTTQVIADSGTIIPGAGLLRRRPGRRRRSSRTSCPSRWRPTPWTASSSRWASTSTPPWSSTTATHFTQAGLDPGQAPGTLEEMRSAAREAEGRRGHPDPVSAWSPLPGRSEWWLTGVKQPIVNENNGRDGLATRVEFANDQTTRLFDFWRGMVADGLASAVPGHRGPDQPPLRHGHQQSASMVVDSSAGGEHHRRAARGHRSTPEQLKEAGHRRARRAAARPRPGRGCLPGLEEPGQGQIGGGAWYLTNGGTEEQQAAAWDFMKWFNSTPQQVQWATRGQRPAGGRNQPSRTRSSRRSGTPPSAGSGTPWPSGCWRTSTPTSLVR